MLDQRHAPGSRLARRAVACAEGRSHRLRLSGPVASGVLLTGIAAMLVAATPAFSQPIVGTPLAWAALTASLAFLLFFAFRTERSIVRLPAFIGQREEQR